MPAATAGPEDRTMQRLVIAAASLLMVTTGCKRIDKKLTDEATAAAIAQCDCPEFFERGCGKAADDRRKAAEKVLIDKGYFDDFSQSPEMIALRDADQKCQTMRVEADKMRDARARRGALPTGAELERALKQVPPR
jgi:hypothetical protein